MSLICSVGLAVTLFVWKPALAQMGHQFGDGFGPAGPQTFSTDLVGSQGGGMWGQANGQAGFPGRVWFQSNLADRGLGFQGSYLTLGSKTRLFEDYFDGRWLGEVELHHAIEEGGGFFSNVGLERIFSIDAARTDVSVSVWYDYDGDTRGNFSRPFHQIGASGQIKTPRWDLIGNGYFPIGSTNHAFGDPFGHNCFAGNRIVLIPGIDSALQGFDATLRFRPEALAMINGSIDLGGYHYNSDLVDSFSGGRVRYNMQMLRGLLISAEVNHDERFNTTGLLSLGWLFGANASGRGHEYTPMGRDLESVPRNDHIVRYNREAVVLIDPLTGLPYNVIHVNNESDPLSQTGAFENPFSELALAEANSAPGDVIVVAAGDGTDRNMDQGITLQDNQRLWGIGSRFLVPNADGTLFELCGTGEDRPIISNAGGFAVITMANNNHIGGIDVDATGATFGIFGNGEHGYIQDSIVRNATSSGVRLASVTGNWRIQDNLFENNGGSGLHMLNALDPTSNFLFDGNVANNNGVDGIQLQNISPQSLAFLDNITNGNQRHGIHLADYTFTPGSAPVLIENHIAQENIGRGVMIDGGEGSLQIVNSDFTENVQAGLTIRNWNNLPGQFINIGNVNGNGPSNFSGNGALGNIEFLLLEPGLVNNVSVRGVVSNNGVRGLYGRAVGQDTILNIDILDNVFNDNINDGIYLLANESAVINTLIGSTDSSPNARQQMLGNAIGGGSGIALIADGISAVDPAQINAVVQNVFINNRFNFIFDDGVPVIEFATTGIEVASLNNSVTNVLVRDSQIGAPAATIPPSRDTTIGISGLYANDGNQLINRLTMQNLTMFNDTGVNIFTNIDTYTDISLTDSTLRPNGIQSTPGVRSDNAPFLDNVGAIGVLVQAVGGSTPSGALNRNDRPDIDPLYAPIELVSDGVLDNLTRVNLANNSIQDFHENGVEINAFGDAQMLLNIVGNDVSNNGAGYNNDPGNINVYSVSTVVDPNNLFFFDGMRIHAYDQSTISANIFGNTFRDNFDRGLRLNTFNRATLNAVVNNNTFFGNDRGEDEDNTIPDIGTGIFANNTPLLDSGIFSFEAINNAEFYIRPHESPILLNLDGNPIDTAGVELPADTIGVFFPGNAGVDIFGNAVALGAAQLNLSMSSNALQLLPDIQNFAVAPGQFTLGLDGVTNGFVGPFPSVEPITNVGIAFAQTLLNNEITFFNVNGF